VESGRFSAKSSMLMMVFGSLNRFDHMLGLIRPNSGRVTDSFLSGWLSLPCFRRDRNNRCTSKHKILHTWGSRLDARILEQYMSITEDVIIRARSWRI
jgi:hypothetical protein